MNRTHAIAALTIGILSFTSCQVRQVATIVDNAIPDTFAAVNTGETPAAQETPAPAPPVVAPTTFCEGGVRRTEDRVALEGGQPVPCEQPVAPTVPTVPCTPGESEGGGAFVCPAP